ncbi:hypothetical protein, variant 2 [Cryptococcus amylolentus CBS 6039]|uniref:Major facilitator superfamily (MFS) profile domain-containing protein n=2 Tax=Cryptococcus amylolentus TaxID=104669 RepID=A0A1E3HE78_9TREE|nr:hypothetical protein L202_06988 [Cryptococcus amylolentus CBS 6039]XP_018990424.1 hypothetical protein, variant 1 [Cryptococcus amylolentus CBS 6039]XP_018990425.1 hypothetical protein, variant 2 [Cryptococcus amylolentus CBS 6039]ODO01592.1 hypothetical protein I350_06412 [Cryptococcus amylolentus CBS 6273]ODN74642.1 hypothetical protein L202_06988 [Cryptococcus amylolentus CBS 6039]ODN74643.1 hypothetical protein, variant 1 [Cryptococcus amylolentus CBS 6039]ODN74644.1 hypothetical prote
MPPASRTIMPLEPTSYPFLGNANNVPPSPTSTTKSQVPILPKPDIDNNDISNSSSNMSDIKANDYEFFHSKKFALCFGAMCLNVILFALDQFIITAAVPKIINQFQSLDKLEWLNTAFFVPCAGAILIYTQLMTIVSPRWIYLSAIATFEAGSAICGAAGSMNLLIVGRAVAGLGGAGMWNATYLIGGELIPFSKRPGYFGLFGVSYILASVMGPLVGGAFTDMSDEGWRWCFYINLPVGGVVLFLLLIFLPDTAKLIPFDGQFDHRPTWLKLLRIDWLGGALSVGFVTCLGMGLQWGGVTEDWDDKSVIISLSFSLGLFILLILWSLWFGSRAMVPMPLFRSLHFTAGAWVAFFGYGNVVVYLYYLPLYFEAIKEKSATAAGVLLLALQLTMGVCLVFSGKLGEVTGQAKYVIVAGSCLLATGGGLFTTLKADSPIGRAVGFEVVSGVGLGLVLNIMVVLVQANYLDRPQLVPHATNLFNFWGFVGRIVSMSTATSIFNNKLRIGLSSIGLSEAVEVQIAAAPSAIWELDASQRAEVLVQYTAALVKPFWFVLGLGAMCLISSLFMKDIDLKAVAQQGQQAEINGGDRDGHENYAMQGSDVSSMRRDTSTQDERKGDLYRVSTNETGRV